MDKIFLIILCFITTALYLPLNRRKPLYYWKTKIDDIIPFVPVFIVPYLFYYFIIFGTIIILFNSEHFDKFIITFIIMNIINAVFWFLFPNGVSRPKIKSDGILSNIVSVLYKYDHDCNGCPSGHVSHTMLCCYFLTFVFPPAIPIAIAFFVSLSILFIKQHYIVDFLGGIASFILSLCISYFVL